MLKTPKKPQYLQLSHIGYKTRRYQLKEERRMCGS